MPLMTLLEMTQNILNSIEGDEINSITDTVESEMVAEVIRETYYDLLSSDVIPDHKELIQLEGLSDTTFPNYLKIPDNVVDVIWWKYDVVGSTETAPNYENVTFCEPEAFIARLNMRNPSGTTIQSVADSSGITLLIDNTTRPMYWTSFDNQHIITDSFDNTVDSTLQQSKTQAYCEVEPTWTVSDTFVPDLSTHMFPMLLAEAKSVSFINFKQQASPKEEKRARKHKQRSNRSKYRTRASNPSSYGPNYGRRRP